MYPRRTPFLLSGIQILGVSLLPARCEKVSVWHSMTRACMPCKVGVSSSEAGVCCRCLTVSAGAAIGPEWYNRCPGRPCRPRCAAGVAYIGATLPQGNWAVLTVIQISSTLSAVSCCSRSSFIMSWSFFSCAAALVWKRWDLCCSCCR